MLFVLQRDFPAWAIWLPDRVGEWIGARPAGNGPSGPDVPTLWVTSSAAAGRVGRMTAAEAGLHRGWLSGVQSEVWGGRTGLSSAVGLAGCSRG
jgi:hypothetical protein